MNLVHYSDRKLIGPIGTVEQRHGLSFYDKPCGLWVSVDGNGDGWAEWCRGERFRLHRLTHVHDVDLSAEPGVLWIGCVEAFDAFGQEFGVDGGHPGGIRGVDWRRVAGRFTGLIVAPYLYARRLSPMWYYGWDCASGCIWDDRAIESVTLREVVPIYEPVEEPA